MLVAKLEDEFHAVPLRDDKDSEREEEILLLLDTISVLCFPHSRPLSRPIVKRVRGFRPLAKQALDLDDGSHLGRALYSEEGRRSRAFLTGTIRESFPALRHVLDRFLF